MSRRTRRDKRLKIPRRKACRFESGPGHHSFLAMVFVVLRQVFRIKFGFVSAKRLFRPRIHHCPDIAGVACSRDRQL